MKRTEFSIVICLLAISVSLGQASDEYATRRARLVRDHIEKNGVKNQRVIDAMDATLRHEFVPEIARRRAYFDTALPIGHGQTISSPYIVARMTEQLDPQPDDRVLEVGTGSGYQAAVLSPLVKQVFSIEIVTELGEQAAKTLKRLGYDNVQVRVGDGFKGWPEEAPFDKIIVTCSPENIPQPLIDQLKDGGHMVIPVGERYQQVLYRFTKHGDKLEQQRIESTFFVPMTGTAESKRKIMPNLDRPGIVNGGFEEKTVHGEPLGWYYVRGGSVIDNPKSPEGIRCLSIQKENAERAHALQPVGVDGRKTKTLQLSLTSKGQGIEKDLLSLNSSQVVIEFYDTDRNLCGDAMLPVPAGSFDWTPNTLKFKVPVEAKLAMIEVGLFGASGAISFDDVRLEVVDR